MPARPRARCRSPDWSGGPTPDSADRRSVGRSAYVIVGWSTCSPLGDPTGEVSSLHPAAEAAATASCDSSLGAAARWNHKSTPTAASPTPEKMAALRSAALLAARFRSASLVSRASSLRSRRAMLAPPRAAGCSDCFSASGAFVCAAPGRAPCGRRFFFLRLAIGSYRAAPGSGASPAYWRSPNGGAENWLVKSKATGRLTCVQVCNRCHAVGAIITPSGSWPPAPS